MIRGSLRGKSTAETARLAVVWLAALLLCGGATSGQAEVVHKETVDAGGGLFEWRYRIVPGTAWPPDESYLIIGTYGLQSCGVETTSPGDWAVACEASGPLWNFRITWKGSGTCPAGSLDCPPPANTGYFWFRSSSSTPTTVDWTRSDGLDGPGTTQGPGEPTTLYARVSVWDNHISYGAFNVTEGSHASPEPIVARANLASGWTYTQGVPDAASADMAYLRISTTRRLDLSINVGGHMRRATPTGDAFGGQDTRKMVAGPYELATQWKIAFHGRLLDQNGNILHSPTSLEATNYNTWTQWSPGVNSVAEEQGWLSAGIADAWTGQAPVANYVPMPLQLQVERAQYEGSMMGEPVEIAIASRVLRRGQQDVQGNYRQTIQISLTYAE